MNLDAEIAIVGAGLAGLALARALKTEGRSIVVLEARGRVGGRVLSQDGYDLGPAWIWPHNRRLLALAEELGLGVFPQYSAGRLVFEDANGIVRRDLEFATMGGALRIAGGIGQITNVLANDLADVLHLETPVEQITEDARGAMITARNRTVRSDRVVLALPPRIAAGLGFQVPDVPTWMAGHAKLIAVYDTPFWRSAGLNGDAVSHLGPLMEIHDASPMGSAQGALFGFAAPGSARHAEFSAQAIAQLGRLFGDEAARPKDVMLKDWSADPATATPADLTPPASHPHYRPIASSGRVIFAGTETAPGDGGFLEGALESAAMAHAQLTRAEA